MGSLFRSEEMTLAQLFLQSEAAFACVRELGELGKVQFRDLNPEVSAFQRKFINEVRRCDEMERRLRYLEGELEKLKIPIAPGGNVEAPDPQDMIDLESKFEALETEVKEINTNKETLKRNLLDLIELQHILNKTQVFFQEAESMLTTTDPMDRGGAWPGQGEAEKGLLAPESDGEPTGAGAGLQHTRFTFVTGVIARERMPVFERVLWRACRGNVFLRQAEIEERLEDPTTGQDVYKIVFILFFQGDQLRSRVKKICEGFHATLYQCPETPGERDQMSIAVMNRVNDLNTVLKTTEDHNVTQLEEIAQEIDTWKTKVKKIKSIYHALNMFNLDVTQRCLIAECWCPVEDLDRIQAALSRGTERSGSNVPSILNRMATSDPPPTYFKTNKFTRGYQAIVDAYGVAAYEEVNPTLYTIITFPFLFAVMFGDAGHGLIMFLFALGLILFERRLTGYQGGGEMFVTIFQGRYIIVLMGLFSIYTGLIYNDVYSKSLNVFGSHWNPAYPYTEVSQLVHDNECRCPVEIDGETFGQCVVLGTGENKISIFPREATHSGNPYPFGLDPVWQVAENKLVFTNSYKMKMSVILGIIQMGFGVLLSVFNHLHFKRYINIWFEFIPQVLFLICIFGWLVFLIFYKFCNFYRLPWTAPSLLITLINMFLEFNKAPGAYVNEDYTKDPVKYATEVGDNEYSVFGDSSADAALQAYIMKFLVVVAVICIPWMLVPKPVYLLLKHKRAVKKGTMYRNFNVQENGEDSEEREGMVGEGEREEQVDPGEFEFGEVFIHQAIHTIEYCLGTISNTASYLRLWALSLAHAELSEVLWSMVLTMYGFKIALAYPFLGWILIFALWAFWAVLTIGILLVMEGLSAFLHALRLHWVEFQSKFYVGDGYKFLPFSFERILSGDSDEE